MNNWERSIRCMVNDEFISPFPVTYGIQTSVSLKMVSDAPVKQVVCHALLDGISQYFSMLSSIYGARTTYTTDIPPANEERWYFSFQIETDDGWIFYTRKGIQRFHPAKASMFSIDTGLQLDSWVPGSTFYQIFPDRFKNGNPSIGVKTHEYQFDGHVTQALSCNQTPPAYSEGWCLDFYNGDLEGISQAVDHFKELGITAVYLNPIFSAKTHHRYDCTDFFHVDEHLGGDEALIHLVGKLHDAGIRIMLDISINHSGSEHAWFKKAMEDAHSPEAAYYYKDDQGEFVFWEGVHTLPQLNYSNSELRNIMYRDNHSVLQKFIQEPFCIDAWRFDVGTDTGRYGKDQFCHEIWREVRKHLKAVQPETYLIGEAWEDASDYLQGDQWDSAMNYFGSGRLLRRWYGQQDTYLMSDWGHSDESGRPLTGKELSDAISQHLNAIPDQLVDRQFNLLDSHDTMRLHNHTRIFDWDMYEGIIMLLYVLPGVPNIYYGDEIGLSGTIESNEGARYPMQWEKDTWDLRFYNLYKMLGNLRNNSQVFAKGDWRTEWYDNSTVIFSRTYKQEGILLCLNRSDTEKHISLDLHHMAIDTIREWTSEKTLDISDDVFQIKTQPKKSMLFYYTLKE